MPALHRTVKTRPPLRHSRYSGKDKAMPEETVLIQPVTVERDKDGWWVHPDMPDFDENYAALKTWIAEQHLEIQQWHKEADIYGHHPYGDGECHCLGWNPVAPAPE